MSQYSYGDCSAHMNRYILAAYCGVLYGPHLEVDSGILLHCPDLQLWTADYPNIPLIVSARAALNVLSLRVLFLGASLVLCKALRTTGRRVRPNHRQRGVRDFPHPTWDVEQRAWFCPRQ